MPQIYPTLERVIGDPPRMIHSCALPETNAELDDIARNYHAYIKIKAMSNKDTYKYLTFEQFILLFTPRPGRDWAYTDNRMSAMQRRKNGHRS